MDKCGLGVFVFIHLPVLITGLCLTTSSWCPSRCTCDYRQGITVSAVCSRQKMTSVPSTLPKSLEYLDLSRNEITNIHSDVFDNCTSLVILDLSFNKIKSLIAPSLSSGYNFSFNIIPSLGKNVSRHDNDVSKVHTYENLHDTNGYTYYKTNSVVKNGSFSGLISLQDLILHHNLLERLDADIFTPLIQMKSLDLSFNRLQHLDDGTFRALTFLEKLNLQYNILSPSSETFSGQLFDDLESLKELNLHNNFPPGSSSTKDACYPDKALSKLLNLERLLMDGYFSSSCLLGTGFRNLTKLSLLDLQIPGKICNIEILPRIFFSNISTTRDLNVSLRNCRIRFIHSDAFSFLPTLTSLNLEDNAQLEFEGFENGSASLKKTRIKFLDISHIHRDSLIKFYSHHLRHLQNTSLEVFIMKYNLIFTIEPTLPLMLPKSLKEWDLSNNKLIDAKVFNYVIFLTHLEIFNISVQNRYTVMDSNGPLKVNVQGFLIHPQVNFESDSVSWKNSTNSKNRGIHLPVSRNQITQDKSISDGIKPESKTSTLKQFASKNSIFKIARVSSDEWVANLSKFCPNYADSFTLRDNKTFVIWVSNKENFKAANKNRIKCCSNRIGKLHFVPIPKSLRQLYASDLKLGYSIPSIKFFNNKVLEILDFSHDFLHCWDGPLSGLSAVKVLDLSYNYCQAVSKYFFQDFNNLRQLFLSHNSLGPSLRYDQSGDTFSHLWQLEYLDLSYNYVEELSRFSFHQNKHLKCLRLSHNALNKFLPNLFQLRNLTYLDLSNNILYSLSQNNIRDLDIIQETSNVSVNLLHNPLRCDCSTEYFISWYRKTLVTLVNHDQYTCLYENGSVIPFDSISDLYSDFYRQCHGQHYLTVTLILCVFVTAVYSFTGMMFYYKHLLYFHLFLRKQQSLRHIWQPHQRRMRDVYIVFDNQDIQWRRHVIDVLIPNLSRHGISYHVAEVGLDEPSAGRPIRQVVEESVLSGKKTLVLLTEDVFLEEENQLAVSMARIVQDRTHCEVLLFLGAQKLKVGDLSPHIYQLLCTSRIIKYMPDDPTFWNRFIKDINNDRVLGTDLPEINVY